MHEGAPEPQRDPRAQRQREPDGQRLSGGRSLAESPCRGIAAGTGGNLVIGGRGLAVQEAEHRAEGSQPDAPSRRPVGLSQSS